MTKGAYFLIKACIAMQISFECLTVQDLLYDWSSYLFTLSAQLEASVPSFAAKLPCSPLNHAKMGRALPARRST